MNSMCRTAVILAHAVAGFASSGCIGSLTGGWELPTRRQVHQALEKREALSYSQFCARHGMKPVFSRPVIFPSHWDPEELREAIRAHAEKADGNRFFSLDQKNVFLDQRRLLHQQVEITPESWRSMIFDDVNVDNPDGLATFEAFGTPPHSAAGIIKYHFHQWFPGAEEKFTVDGEVRAHYMLNGKSPNAFGGINREYDVIFELRDVIIGYMRLNNPRVNIVREFDFYFPPEVRRVIFFSDEYRKSRSIEYYLNNRPRREETRGRRWMEESKAWYLNGQLRSVTRLEKERGYDIKRYQLWSEDGEPVFDKAYYGRVLHGRCREWDEGGKLIMDTLHDLGTPVRDYLKEEE